MLTSIPKSQRPTFLIPDLVRFVAVVATLLFILGIRAYNVKNDPAELLNISSLRVRINLSNCCNKLYIKFDES